MDDVRKRTDALERLYLDDVQTESDILSVEGLLDTLSALWDECSALKRERNITAYVERSKNMLNSGSAN